MSNIGHYIRHILNLRFAIVGVLRAIRSEKSFHLIGAGETVLFIISVSLGTPGWRLGIIAYSFLSVLGLELMNTAVELTGDRAADGWRDNTIMHAKDFAAGAILIIGSGAFLLWGALTFF